MVEHAAVNRGVVGSSPTSGANFIEGIEDPQSFDTDPAQISEGSGARIRKVKFPVTIEHRRFSAKIYGKSVAYPFYRVAYKAGGKRIIRSFSEFKEAKAAAQSKVRELAQGSQTAALSSKDASAALAIRDALESFARQTGHAFTALEAVTGFLDGVKYLPAGYSLPEAVRSFAATVAVVQGKPVAEAAEEFLAIRAPKAKAAEGRRSQLSPVYEAHVESWLREFTKMFPGHSLGDLNKDLLSRYVSTLEKLSPKSKNDRRAALAMFFRWCVRQNYLPPTQRLTGADAMQKEPLDAAPTEFYRPAELRALLGAARGQMRAVIAVQALAGLRLEEARKLKWENVFGVEGHIEITALNAKTRRRRLVEICPALKAWLEPYRECTGKVWTDTATLNGFVSAFARLRDSLGIPSRRNGLRHAFCSFHFAVHANENLTAAQAGNSPAMIHQHYKGLATRAEAEKWFNVCPAGETP